MALLRCSINLFAFLCSSSFAWISTPLEKGKGTCWEKMGRLKSWSSKSFDATTATSNTKMTTCAEEMGRTSVVTIDCRLVPEGGIVLEPLIDGVVLHPVDPMVELKFILGLGNYLPGLHSLIKDMKVGEMRENQSLDAGWGGRNPNLVVTLRLANVGIDQQQIQVGRQLSWPAKGITFTITEVTDETFTMDGNHPLAGASYAATVVLKSLEPGPAILPYDASNNDDDDIATTSTTENRYEVATFALGCFWGGELAFMREPGVLGTLVGYTQGSVAGPTYEQVCSGTTGHTEAIAVIYDSHVVSYERLVHLAMDRLGDSKYLLNQVGNDKGTQYRHGIYYHSHHQQEMAQAILNTFGRNCVTECYPAKTFWVAEEYHQQYLLKGGQSARKGEDAVIGCYG